MYLHSVAAYADKIVDELDKNSVEYLRSLPEEDLGLLHHSWGMAIRNQFGFWKADHPLTKNWHTCPETHLIRDGVDYSEDHPDSISMKIMKQVWEKVNADWHTRPETHLIRDGVDYSEDHPDSISMKIMKRVWEKVNAE